VNVRPGTNEIGTDPVLLIDVQPEGNAVNPDLKKENELESAKKNVAK